MLHSCVLRDFEIRFRVTGVSLNILLDRLLSRIAFQELSGSEISGAVLRSDPNDNFEV